MAPDTPAPLIEVVDDDPLFGETLAGNLEDAGFRVRYRSDGDSFLAALDDASAPDLVLLDWKMPGLNGIEVLRRLRNAGHQVPVIFLTVLSDQIYEEAALLGGAVDFIEKARSFTILERRLRLVLERSRPPVDQDGRAGTGLKVGPLSLDTDSRRATWRGSPVDLTLSEFAMTLALAAKAGRDVSYRELYDAGRGKGFHAGSGADGYRTNVRAAIKRLREKFRAIDPDFTQIENYPGFGYVWKVDADGVA